MRNLLDVLACLTIIVVCLVEFPFGEKLLMIFDNKIELILFYFAGGG